jgi:hypothetical protein
MALTSSALTTKEEGDETPVEKQFSITLQHDGPCVLKNETKCALLQLYCYWFALISSVNQVPMVACTSRLTPCNQYWQQLHTGGRVHNNWSNIISRYLSANFNLKTDLKWPCQRHFKCVFRLKSALILNDIRVCISSH